MGKRATFTRKYVTFYASTFWFLSRGSERTRVDTEAASDPQARDNQTVSSGKMAYS